MITLNLAAGFLSLKVSQMLFAHCVAVFSLMVARESCERLLGASCLLYQVLVHSLCPTGSGPSAKLSTVICLRNPRLSDPQCSRQRKLSGSLCQSALPGIIEHWIANYFLASQPLAGSALSFATRIGNSYWGTEISVWRLVYIPATDEKKSSIRPSNAQHYYCSLGVTLCKYSRVTCTF